MQNVFNAAEVVDMGIAKEKKRRDFYGRVAESFAKDRAMRKLFADLKGWEEAHIKKFTQIRMGMEEAEVIESYQGEFEAYIKALVDDKLYDQVAPANFKRSVKKPLDAIRYGIGFEKDSILFFGELLRYMSGPHKDKVQLLINEEKQHLIYLSQLKKKFE